MWEELGISGGTAIIILIVLYLSLNGLLKIVLKEKEEFNFRVANKIKNIDYHEVNLNKFVESYKQYEENF